MRKRHFRIIPGNLFDDLSPQSGRIQYVGLIYTDHVLSAFHGNVKCLYGNSSNLVLVICKGIHGCHHAVHFRRMALSEIQTAGQFPHDDHVKSIADDLLF